MAVSKDSPAGCLSPEEEAELVLAWQDEGDREARDRLIAAHEPVVRRAVRRQRGPVQSDSRPAFREDLEQVGRHALLRALESYDPEYGSRFGAYARAAVTNAVIDAVGSDSDPPPEHRARRFRTRYRDAENEFYREHGRWPALAEIAPGLFPDLSQEEATRKASRLLDQLEDAERLDADLPQGGEDDPQTFHEKEADPATDPRPEAERGRKMARRHGAATDSRIWLVRSYVDQLPERQRYVVQATLGLDGDGCRTPEDIAAELSERTGEQVRPWSVRRSRKRAAERLREHLDATLEPGRYEDPFTAVLGLERESPYVDPFVAVENE